MSLNRFLVVLIVFALSSPAGAQQAKRIPRIGFVSGNPTSLEIFRNTLHGLGYSPGQNILIDSRIAADANVVPNIIEDFVRLKVDVIVVSTTPAALAAISDGSAWCLILRLLLS
jgi:ABC-type uncharacterized transport system substrate-binding protein